MSKFIFVHEDEYNQSYEDNFVMRSYFETYGEAYEDIINNLAANYFASKGENYCEDYYPHTHYIVKIEFGANTREIVSVYNCEHKKWLHGDEAKDCHWDDEVNRLYKMSELISTIYNGCGNYQINKYLESHNVEILDELVGYQEFCKRTLKKYLRGKISQYIRLYHYHNINGDWEARDRVISDFITPLKAQLNQIK